jgi:hypothetical protein
MGGGREILTLISALAVVEIDAVIANDKNNVPKNNFFILLSPLIRILLPPSALLVTNNEKNDTSHERNGPQNGW